MTTCSIFPHNTDQAIMSPKVYLSRRLAKERIDCPGCGKNLRVSTLAWVHHCKRPSSEATIQAKLAKVREMAVKRFESRTQPMVGILTDPTDTSTQDQAGGG